MLPRDISSYDVAQLIIQGAKLQASLDDLNRTISQRETDLVVNMSTLVNNSLAYIENHYNSILPIINRTPALIEQTSQTLTLISDRLDYSFIIIGSLLFFGIGALILFFTCILFYEYKNYRKHGFFTKQNILKETMLDSVGDL